MELESTQSSTATKLPMLKQVAETTTDDAGTLTTLIPSPVTIEEKAKKRMMSKQEEDLNLKFLRSLPSEWNTHVVVWRNKSDLDTMSLDDLYNNFKIVEQEVKGTTSTNTSSQNMAFVSSPSPNSTNEVPTVFGVSTASPQVSTANLNDATVYAFLANQPNGSQLVHEDLEQTHEDDLEEIDLKWQLELLSMRAKRRATYNNRKFFKKVNTAKEKVNTARPNSAVLNAVRENKGKAGHSHKQIKDQGYFNSGCSRHMTGNISYLTNFKEFDEGYVAFGGGSKGGKITGKGTIRIGKLDFKDVCFFKEIQFNLFSVSQMCDKKNSVFFTDTECFVLSPDFKLADESHVLLKVPRKNNMYSVDMKKIVLKMDLTCLVAKVTNVESML
nr:ribonuclease H-like domain-containing protein [Tanacetum cinerariifolium]